MTVDTLVLIVSLILLTVLIGLMKRALAWLRKDSSTDWSNELTNFISDAADGNQELKVYAKANADACRDVTEGIDFYSGTRGHDGGARMVANISSAHVPSFCLASRNGDPRPYKNGYDLGHFHIGAKGSKSEPRLRETVDAALPLGSGVSPNDIYFGALELTGAGIRFYGDVCLVLRREEVAADTVVLDRNSFDLITPPLRDRINRSAEGKPRQAARGIEAQKLAGYWDKDAGNMAALKALQSVGLRTRRYTAGQIAEAIRYDEDYLEILKKGSFGAKNLQEVRFSTGEAAHDAFTAERTNNGPPPRLESLMFLYRRRQAEQELRKDGVGVRVVTSLGRE